MIKKKKKALLVSLQLQDLQIKMFITQQLRSLGLYGHYGAVTEP